MKPYVFSGPFALVLGACAYESTPLPIVADQQAVTNSSVLSPLQHQNPFVGYIYRAPTGPRDWRSVNEEQTEGN